MTLIIKYFALLTKFLSYFFIGFILLLILIPTQATWSRPEELFMKIIIYLIGVTILNLIFIKRRIKFVWGDLIIFLLFLYFVFNYYILSEVQAGTSFSFFIYLVIFYICLRIILPAYPRVDRFLLFIIMMGGIYEATTGLKQILDLEPSNHHLYAVTGSFFNPGPYGGYLAVILSMALYYLINHYHAFCCLTKRGRWKEKLILFTKVWFITYILCCIAFCTSFIVFFSTFSRSAWLAFFICGAIISLTYNSYYKKFLQFLKKKKACILIVLIVVVFLGIGLWNIYTLKRSSADGRLLIWKVSSAIIKENPWTGTGIGSYLGEYGKYQAIYFNNNSNTQEIYAAGVPEYAFNEYLKIGVETGIFSLFIILAILIYCLMRLYKKKSAFTYGLLALMIFAISSYPLSLLPFQILFVLFIAIAFSKNNYIISKSPDIRLFFISLLVLCFVYGTLLFRPFKDIIKNEKDQSLIESIAITDSKTRFLLKEYALMYPYLYNKPGFLFDYGKVLNIAGNYRLSNQLLKEATKYTSDPMCYNIMGNNYKKLGNFEMTEKNYKYAFDVLPNRIYPLFLLMQLYDENGEKDKAKKMAEKLIYFDPKIISPATDEIKEKAKELLARYEEGQIN